MLIMKKRSQVEILRKRIFWAPNGSRTHDLPDTGRSWVRLPLRAQKILFLSISPLTRFFIIYTLSKSPIHLSRKMFSSIKTVQNLLLDMDRLLISVHQHNTSFYFYSLPSFVNNDNITVSMLIEHFSQNMVSFCGIMCQLILQIKQQRDKIVS